MTKVDYEIVGEEEVRTLPIIEPVNYTMNVEVKKTKTKTKKPVELVIVEEEVGEEEVVDSNVSILTAKLHKAGIDVLDIILKKEFRCRITNLKNSRAPLEKRRTIAIDAILSERALNNNETKADDILQKYFEAKVEANINKKQKNLMELLKYNVGEEVLVYMDYIYRKGRVSKFNSASMSIQLYGYDRIDDLDALKNQSYGKDRLIWLNFVEQTIIKYNSNGIIKKGNSEYYDKLFIEGEKKVDYGY